MYWKKDCMYLENKENNKRKGKKTENRKNKKYERKKN